QQAEDFWAALKAVPYEIVQGRISNPNISMSSFLDSVKIVAQTMHRLKPTLNEQEFEHYRLMSDIRLQYLRYVDIERRVNADDFRAEDVPEVLADLKALNTVDLDNFFMRLNRGTFYEGELKLENEYRNSKIQLLY